MATTQVEVASQALEVAFSDAAFNEPFDFPSNEIKTSKYNIITFLPLTLMEQFRRVSNVYFALVAAIGFIPGASPFTPLSNAAPLIFVLAVAIVKAGYEDFKRHRSDAKANRLPARVFRNGGWETVESRDVQVGDLLLVENGEEIRADCCLLFSSDAEGLAYVDTAMLDGETSLKTKRCRPFTQSHFNDDTIASHMADDAKERRWVAVIDPPCAKLDSWNGVIELRTREEQKSVIESTSVGMQQFLPRGSNLRNVDVAIGAVVYSGVDTKMFLNLKHKKAKLSHLDRSLNRFIGGVFVINQLMVIALCAGAVVWTDDNPPSKLWYAAPMMSSTSQGYVFFWQFMGFFALLSFMIPISLFVSLELVKVVQAVFMATDKRMSCVDEKTGVVRSCRPKTSDLNDQLAQVRFIFTDKTGTLTENKMNLLQLVSGSHMHNEVVQPGGLKARLERETERDFEKNRFHGLMMALSMCHTVLSFPRPAEENGTMYDGTSPDEVALVRSASRNGYALLSRNAQKVVVDVFGQRVEADILAELEFSPERKRMSVLLRVSDGRIVLLTKGADAAMLPLCDSHDAQTRDMRYNVEQELDAMSLQGLRTLVLGYRIISEDECKKWLALFEEANRSMTHRVAALHEAYEFIEYGFRLFGATGVEDKLQDGVEDTIRFFLDAGVTVWMLTGDKRETAMTIASTSGLWKPENVAHHLDVTQEFDPRSDPKDMWNFLQIDLDRMAKDIRENPHNRFLVIDGLTLGVFLQFDPDLFTELGSLCVGAVCCRLTPIQKADCVRLFQTLSGQTVLAIGDGANDVSMIQQARVGIGIMGLEGSQAELSSDYAIPRFHHLKTLLAVHGRFAWYRNTTKILYCFYKNIQLSLVLLVYTFWSGYSVQTFFDSWMISLYNTFFTVWFPLSIGMFDKDIKDELALANPKLYAAVRDEQKHFNVRAFLDWGWETILHSCICCGLAYLYATHDDLSFHSASLQHVSTTVFVHLLAIVCAMACLRIQRWDAIQVATLAMSVVSIPVYLFTYSAFDHVESTSELAGLSEEAFRSADIYFGSVCTVVVFLLLTLTRRFICIWELPSVTDVIVREWNAARRRPLQPRMRAEPR